MAGREEEWKNQEEECERPVPPNSRICVFVSVLPSQGCFKHSSVELLPWTLLLQTKIKHGEERAESLVSGAALVCGGLPLIISALASNLPAAAAAGNQLRADLGDSGRLAWKSSQRFRSPPAALPLLCQLTHCAFISYFQEKRFTPTHTHSHTHHPQRVSSRCSCRLLQ